jgi:hypothetical protein
MSKNSLIGEINVCAECQHLILAFDPKNARCWYNHYCRQSPLSRKEIEKIVEIKKDQFKEWLARVKKGMLQGDRSVLCEECSSEKEVILFHNCRYVRKSLAECPHYQGVFKIKWEKFFQIFPKIIGDKLVFFKYVERRQRRGIVNRTFAFSVERLFLNYWEYRLIPIRKNCSVREH